MRFFLRHYILSVVKRVNNEVLQAKWAIIFIIAYFVCLRKYFYSTCLAVVATGLPCPACGLTRAFFQLINCDFKGALVTHPFVYIIVLLFVLWSFNRYVLLRQNPKWLKWMTIICVLGMVGFYIWRMMMFFPGEPPMSYYSKNLISEILNLINNNE